MSKKIFVIKVVNHDIRRTSKISQEAYRTLERAQRFIETRGDKPEKKTEYSYLSGKYSYLIEECIVVD